MIGFNPQIDTFFEHSTGLTTGENLFSSRINKIKNAVEQRFPCLKSAKTSSAHSLADKKVVVLPPTIQPDLKSHLQMGHENGNLAIHMTKDLLLMDKRLDHPAILGNLREDGGDQLIKTSRSQQRIVTSESRCLNCPKDYQLQTIISTTLLASSEHNNIGQTLFNGRIFWIFDKAKSRVKDYCFCDTFSDYRQKNKHGRSTYEPVCPRRDRSLSHKQQSEKADRDSQFQTEIATLTSEKFTSDQRANPAFTMQHRDPPTFIRPMNEMLLKVNGESALCIGTLAQNVVREPELISELRVYQKALREETGITYPIALYNNQKK
jgi:hypothetical protein